MYMHGHNGAPENLKTHLAQPNISAKLWLEARFVGQKSALSEFAPDA
jgi:hypothetical protein